MTIELEKEILTKFIRLKWKQMACLLFRRLYQKIGYVNSEVGQMMEVLKVQANEEEILKELSQLLVDNGTYFEAFSSQKDIDNRLAELNISVSREEQKELSRECTGKAWSLDDFAEKL